MSLETKRIKELFGYARTLTKEQGVGVMAARAAGFFKPAVLRQKGPLPARQANAGHPACGRRAKRQKLAGYQHFDAAVQHTAAIPAAISGQRAGPDVP